MSSRGRVPETLGALEVAPTDADPAAPGEAIAGERHAEVVRGQIAS